MSIRIGCSGWSYNDWVGPFYPTDAKPDEYLRLYSRVFDTVEVDSTFYRVPSAEMVKQWYSVTSNNFIFCPKLPKRITHEFHLENSLPYFEHFTKRLSTLQEKLGPFLIQLPPSFKFPKNLQQFTSFLETLREDYRYAVEFRHKSWFNPEVEKLLTDQSLCQAWSINQYLSTPPTLTTDFVYLRFVGDREINQFNTIQKDQTDELKKWKSLLSQSTGSREKFVLFNNHFAGFGPGSVNEFRRLMELAELDWSNLKTDLAQKSMLDF